MTAFSNHNQPRSATARKQVLFKEMPVLHLRSGIYVLLLMLVLFLSGGCATAPPVSSKDTTAPTTDVTPDKAHGEQKPSATGYSVVTVTASDSYATLARSWLGSERLAYLISESNDNRPLTPGMRVVIPLKPVNPGGLYPDGFQTVPVLCYHQFSPGTSTNKIMVSAEMFDRQMAYLKNNGYQVITLEQFADFVEFRRRPPKKAVLLTIDDGWKTVRTIAYPILKKYGFSAVLFTYTDLIKTRRNSKALSWDDIREMVTAGVLEVASHTVSHTDLTKINKEQLFRELQDSKGRIKERLGIDVSWLAYPYGTFNDQVISAMRETGYRGGFTVVRGANAFFNDIWSLNRSMIFNSDRLDDFVRSLETYRRSN